MKRIKYNLAIFLSVVPFLLCLGSLGLYYYYRSSYTIILFVISFITIFLTKEPLHNLRILTREAVEYDEFGRSKTKGDYKKLSRAERDAIDLQKTADMERILSSSVLKKMIKKGSEDPESEIKKLIALQPVKQKMNEMVARMMFEQEQIKDKQKKERISMSGRHMCFYGNPGTGKTTVARIITGFLYKYGYIKENKCVEVDGNFLKAGNSTAVKTELIIQKAYNGVLFIDEAYSLNDSIYGKEAIASIIKQMEDHRDKFILILAGYTNEMKQLLARNPGFESRIKEYLNFPDYGITEMEEIFCLMAKKQGFKVDEKCFEAFEERIQKEMPLRSFGNARTVRNILDESIDKHAYNYINNIIASNNKYIICKEDISISLKNL